MLDMISILNMFFHCMNKINKMANMTGIFKKNYLKKNYLIIAKTD